MPTGEGEAPRGEAAVLSLQRWPGSCCDRVRRAVIPRHRPCVKEVTQTMCWASSNQLNFLRTKTEVFWKRWNPLKTSASIPV